MTQSDVERINASLEQLAAVLQTLFVGMFDIVHTENWKSYNIDEQQIVRNLVETYTASAAIIREKFDSDVWKGHADGTVSTVIESVRKQRDGETPGKKAEPKTPENVLAKRLGKK